MVTAASSPIVDTKPSALSAQTSRLVSVDVIRGLVLVLMALDHTRDFFSALRIAPEDMAHTYGALFFTRFITHYCAPVFTFLAGTLYLPSLGLLHRGEPVSERAIEPAPELGALFRRGYGF